MRLIVPFVLAAALLPGAAAAQQQQPSTEARLAALEEAQRQILKELQEIKALLLARPANPAPAPAPKPAPPALPAFDLTIAGSPAKGRADAPVVIVEFSDFECPFCARYVRDTLPRLEREYVDTGKVRYVFRHYPIQSIHPRAMGAAQAGVCAAAQGKFWELHAELFANQRALQPESLTAAAQKLGLNVDTFRLCQAAQASASAAIKLDLDEGTRAVISGTPTFFLGTLTKEGRVKVARRLVGAQSFANFKSAIDSLIAQSR
jgi:protein-disulfide isomerase